MKTCLRMQCFSKWANLSTLHIIQQTFIRAFGAEAGDLALKTLPFGGLYVAGGMAPKILWAMQQDQEFMRHFTMKVGVHRTLK